MATPATSIKFVPLTGVGTVPSSSAPNDDDVVVDASKGLKVLSPTLVILKFVLLLLWVSVVCRSVLGAVIFWPPMS